MARVPAIREQADFELPSGIVLPSQFFYGKSQARLVCGERRLMLALLSEAFFCLLTSHDRSRRTEVLNWVAGGTSPVPFEDACSAVGLDPRAVSERLQLLARGVHGATRRADLLRKHRSG